MELYPNLPAAGWSLFLYKNGNGSSHIDIPGGTGAPSSFQVVIDVPGQIVYAIYNFGSGPQTTSTLSLAGNTSLSQWNALSVVGDYRFGFSQDQIDNISLTQTAAPEPSTLLLVALGGIALMINRKRW